MLVEITLRHLEDLDLLRRRQHVPLPALLRRGRQGASNRLSFDCIAKILLAFLRIFGPAPDNDVRADRALELLKVTRLLLFVATLLDGRWQLLRLSGAGLRALRLGVVVGACGARRGRAVADASEVERAVLLLFLLASGHPRPQRRVADADLGELVCAAVGRSAVLAGAASPALLKGDGQLLLVEADAMTVVLQLVEQVRVVVQ